MNKIWVLTICLIVATAQCPVDIHCPEGDICAMTRQGYGRATPECISSGGVDAALLDQAMQRAPAGPGTGIDRHRFNHYRGSQYHSSLFHRPYHRFRNHRVGNIWRGGPRYPIRRHMYPFRFRRPVSMFSGYVSPTLQGFQNSRLGFRPNVVESRSEPIRANVTVDNNNKNVLEQNGSSNVQVNQVAKQSNTPRPTVNDQSRVIPLHPGPLVPVKIHDINVPGIQPDVSSSEVHSPSVNHRSHVIPLRPGPLLPVQIHGPGLQQEIARPVVDPPVILAEERRNQGIPLSFANPHAV